MRVHWRVHHWVSPDRVKMSAHIFGIRVPVRFAIAWARFWSRFL